MTLSGPSAPGWGGLRGEAPTARFVLLVALTLLLGILMVVSGFLFSESVSKPPTGAVIETNLDPNGTLVIAHRSGETIDTGHLRVTGPVAEAHPFETETFGPGDRLRLNLEGEGTVAVVWEDGEMSVTLERFDTSTYDDSPRRWSR